MIGPRISRGSRARGKRGADRVSDRTGTQQTGSSARLEPKGQDMYPPRGENAADGPVSCAICAAPIRDTPVRQPPPRKPTHAHLPHLRHPLLPPESRAGLLPRLAAPLRPPHFRRLPISSAPRRLCARHSPQPRTKNHERPPPRSSATSAVDTPNQEPSPSRPFVSFVLFVVEALTRATAAAPAPEFPAPVAGPSRQISRYRA